MAQMPRLLQDYLKVILDNIPNMVFVKDARDLSFVLLNKTGEELLGLREEEVLGKTDYDFFPKEQADSFIAKDHEVLQRGDMEEIPLEPIETKSGRRWLHTKKVPVVGADGQPLFLLGLSEDVTALKNALDTVERTEAAEQERKRYLAILEKSNRELAEFSHIASHDLKTPLRGISRYSSFLLEDYHDKLDEPGREMLTTLKNLTDRLESYLDALLNYSRLEKTALAIRETDIAALVHDVLNFYALQIKETKTEVMVAADLPSLICDHIRIAEVFQNLIGNSLKYNDKPERKIEIGCLRNHERCPQENVFFIRDNGIGIAPKHFETIFTMFRRLHPADAYGGGTGSGLAITREIIRRHRGDIWVESEGEGRGVTFCFTIGRPRLLHKGLPAGAMEQNNIASFSTASR